jgi:hypothetical protein
MSIQIALNTQEQLLQGAQSVSKVLDALRVRALNVSKVLDALRVRALIAKEL